MAGRKSVDEENRQSMPQAERRDETDNRPDVHEAAEQPAAPRGRRDPRILPTSGDDNPYQNSDEALPEAEEEVSLARDPSREGSRFSEI